MPTLSIAVLTFRRADELIRCLQSIARSLAAPLPEPWQLEEILVVDNDPDGSARDVVDHLTTAGRLPPVRYVHEARSGVAWARNRALDEARSSTLIFIDDDEVAEAGWPHGLLNTMAETGAAMVGGPVLTRFTVEPPDWVTEGRFFERRNPPHHSRSHWLRSGNVAIDLDQVRAVDLRFDPKYRHGEDAAFSMEGATRGLDLRWSSLGSVTEFVGPDRLSVRWRVHRARISHRAWATTIMDLQRPVPTAVTVLLRGVQLLLRGATRVAGGVITGRTHTAVAGLCDGVAIVGRIEAVVDHFRPPRTSRSEPPGAPALPTTGYPPDQDQPEP